MKWIDVNDRLPQVDQTVIVLENYSPNDHLKYSPYAIVEDISGAIYWSDGNFYLDHPTRDHPYYLDHVTHWMTLPSPPDVE